jgi:pimeloyl-ACP methyl ester carboxylesterase
MPDVVVRQGLGSAFAPDFPVPDVFVRDLRATGLRGFLSTTRAIDSYLDDRSLPERMAGLECPIKVVFGLRDQRVDPSSVDDYRYLRNVDVTTLEGSGHTPPWEQPDAVAAAILNR